MFDGLLYSGTSLIIDGKAYPSDHLWHMAFANSHVEPKPVMIGNTMTSFVQILSNQMRGVAFSGYAPFMKGYLSGILEREVGDALGESPAGMISLSSGHSGRPSVRSYKLYKDVETEKAMSEVITRVLPIGTVMVVAPFATSFMQYIALLSAGYNVVTTSNPTPENIKSLIDSCDIIATRPSGIESAMKRGGYGKPIRGFMTATGPLTESQLQFLVDQGAENVLDCFVTSEAGIIGSRNAIEQEAFDIMPYVWIRNGYVYSWTVNGVFQNGRFIQKQSFAIGDDIDVKNFSFKYKGRGKVKVHGFTVPLTPLEDILMEMPGVTKARATVDGASYGNSRIVVEYEGLCYNDEEIRTALRQVLPFYAIPQEIVNVPEGSLNYSANGEQHG